MEYLLTDHAKKGIAKRRICFSWIEEALACPARMHKRGQTLRYKRTIGFLPNKNL